VRLLPNAEEVILIGLLILGMLTFVAWY